MAAPLWTGLKSPGHPSHPAPPPLLLVSSLWPRVSCHFSSGGCSVSHNKEKREIFPVALSQSKVGEWFMWGFKLSTTNVWWQTSKQQLHLSTGLTGKGPEGTFWENGNVLEMSCFDSTVVTQCLCSSKLTDLLVSGLCVLFYVSYTSIRGKTKSEKQKHRSGGSHVSMKTVTLFVGVWRKCL